MNDEARKLARHLAEDAAQLGMPAGRRRAERLLELLDEVVTMKPYSNLVEFRCWCPDTEAEADGRVRDGVVARFAAEKYAQDCAEMRGDGHDGSIDIIHARHPDGSLSVVEVTGKLVPRYTGKVL